MQVRFPIEILPREPQVEFELDVIPVRVGVACVRAERLLLLPLPHGLLGVVRAQSRRVQTPVARREFVVGEDVFPDAINSCSS